MSAHQVKVIFGDLNFRFMNQELIRKDVESTLRDKVKAEIKQHIYI